MKKLLILIFAVVAMLALTGCEPDTQKRVIFEDGTKVYTRRFKYDGHVYIEFARVGSGAYDNYTGFDHDPECLKKDIKAILEAHKQ